MAAHRPFLFLGVCLFLLCQETFAKTDAPCQLSKWNNGYQTFLKRHIPSGTPGSLDQNQWEKYIKSLGTCARPTQSFLRPEDLEKVKAVCTNRGGKVFKNNLCISQQPFTFVTVRSQLNTCEIKKVQYETKHLILACELLDNQCVPVHFEGNPSNEKPDNNARACQDPSTGSGAPSFKMSWVCLLLAFLMVIYDF